MSNFKCSAVSHTGNVHHGHVDHYVADADLGLWLVADGLVSQTGGKASRIVADTITDSVRQGSELTSAIQHAHAHILEAANDVEMTSTVVAAQQVNNDLELAWVGNSRAYLFDRSAQKPLRLLSRDHSYLQALLETGSFTDADLVNPRYQTAMTLSLGDMGAPMLNADHMLQTLTPMQKLILCSDGLTREVGEDEMIEILSSSGDIENNANALMRAALDNGGSDNITVIVISRA